MTYAEKKRLRVAAFDQSMSDVTDFALSDDAVRRIAERTDGMEGMQSNRKDTVINSIERLHSRRDALLKASSIARSILSRAKSCGEAYKLRKAAEEMKHEADRMGEEMVKVWMAEAMDNR